MDDDEEEPLFPASLEEPDKTPEDIFGDSSVMKVLATPGIQTWKKPKADGGEVRFSYRAKAENGTIVQEGSKIDYMLGSQTLGALGSVFDKTLQSMCTSEKATLTCGEDVAYKGQGHGKVTIELCLHEIYTITDVSLLKDGTVKKKTLEQGTGFDKPNDDGYQVTVKVEFIKNECNDILPGFSGPAELSFESGNGEVCDALEGAVGDMKRNERALLRCSQPWKVCESRLGVGQVPPEQHIYTMEVWLLSFAKGKDIWSLPEAERVEVAVQKKDIGAKLFKAGRFELALQKYKKVISTIPNHDRFADEVKAKAVDVKKAAELNKAMCFLKVSDFKSALESCNQILADDSNNVKALFRRARASHELKDHVAAMADVERILELDAGNSEAKTLQLQIRRAQKLVDKKSQGTFAKMCQGLGELNEERSTVAGPQWELKPESG